MYHSFEILLLVLLLVVILLLVIIFMLLLKLSKTFDTNVHHLEEAYDFDTEQSCHYDIEEASDDQKKNKFLKKFVFNSSYHQNTIKDLTKAVHSNVAFIFLIFEQIGLILPIMLHNIKNFGYLEAMMKSEFKRDSINQICENKYYCILDYSLYENFNSHAILSFIAFFNDVQDPIHHNVKKYHTLNNYASSYQLGEYVDNIRQLATILGVPDKLIN